ncbi:helix-turn-helix domain-containing protein [Kitasatospora sp. NPDC049258]|uniref:TetR/AcrR family transcriptional regulator n=1 Tax=Kitasatospora sp. NPDC049258 TaxID=3155394 RepID=UPI00344A762F
MVKAAGRPLRADAERSVRAILAAAERVLAQNPGASMEQIAEASGVARTTVHRRFASRQALIDALAVSAVRQLAHAIEESRPDSSPALVMMHRATANVIRVKGAWSFALNLPAMEGSEAADAWAEIDRRCLELLDRARREGVIDADADLGWVARVFYALLGEAVHNRPETDPLDPDALAARIVDTLLHGAAPRGSR